MIIEVDSALRHQDLGAGIVEACTTRDFLGSPRTFAVIRFPHRDMTAHIPLGDPAMEKKLHRVLSEREVRQLIEEIIGIGGRLMRTYEERERVAIARLKTGGPEEWAKLLRDYAHAQANGLQLAVSDVEVVREAREMLAAEVYCAARSDYEAELAGIISLYAQASLPVEDKEEVPV